MDRPRQCPPALAWCIVLAGAAFGLSGYLWVQSTSLSLGATGGLTLCPETDLISCEEVLASPYARWLGVPLAGVGTLSYAGLLAACVGLLAARSVPARRGFWSIAWMLAALGTLAGFWLLWVQIFLLERYCLVCDAVHGCALAVLILLTWCRPAFMWGWFWPAAGAMVLLVAVSLVLGQTYVQPAIPIHRVVASGPVATRPATGPATQPDATCAAAQTQPAPPPRPGRSFDVVDANGQVLLTLDLDGEIVMGDPDTPRTIVEMMDFGCRECKKQFELVEEVLQEHPHWFRLVILLFPGNKECNPYTARTRPHVCEMAKAALAMHKHRPDLYAQLHQKFFVLQGPLTGGMAWQVVKQTAGIDDATLQAWQEDPLLAEKIRRHASIGNVLVSGQKAKGLPTMFANGNLVAGAPGTLARMKQILTRLVGPPDGEAPAAAPASASATRPAVQEQMGEW